MRERMKEKEAAVRKRMREQGYAYCSYCTGEKRMAVFRIGQWKEEWWEPDAKSRTPNRDAKKVRKTRNVTPKKAIRILQTFRREWWLTEIHLYLSPLPADQQEEWKAAFGQTFGDAMYAPSVVYDPPD